MVGGVIMYELFDAFKRNNNRALGPSTVVIAQLEALHSFLISVLTVPNSIDYFFLSWLVVKTLVND